MNEKQGQQLAIFFNVDGYTPSNWISRSSVFSTIKKGERKFSDEVLGEFFGVKLRRIGYELDMADQDVFLWLVKFAKKNYSEKVYFSKYELLKDLNKKLGKSTYDWLEQSLKRLTATTIFYQTKDNKKFIGVHLVDSVQYDEDKKMQFVRLGSEVIDLYKNDNYSFIDWQQRLQLKDFAKWLQCFISSHHKKTKGYFLKTIKESAGKDNVRNDKFKMTIEKSANELIEVGFLKEYELEKRKNDWFFNYTKI